jgi:hypothetical protein
MAKRVQLQAISVFTAELSTKSVGDGMSFQKEFTVRTMRYSSVQGHGCPALYEMDIPSTDQTLVKSSKTVSA